LVEASSPGEAHPLRQRVGRARGGARHGRQFDWLSSSRLTST